MPAGLAGMAGMAVLPQENPQLARAHRGERPGREVEHHKGRYLSPRARRPSQNGQTRMWFCTGFFIPFERWWDGGHPQHVCRGRQAVWSG